MERSRTINRNIIPNKIKTRTLIVERGIIGEYVFPRAQTEMQIPHFDEEEKEEELVTPSSSLHHRSTINLKADTGGLSQPIPEEHSIRTGVQQVAEEISGYMVDSNIRQEMGESSLNIHIQQPSVSPNLDQTHIINSNRGLFPSFRENTQLNRQNTTSIQYEARCCCCKWKRSKKLKTMKSSVRIKWLNILRKIMLMHRVVTHLTNYSKQKMEEKSNIAAHRTKIKESADISKLEPITLKKKFIGVGCIIMPDSIQFLSWSLLMTFMLIWTAFYVPFRLAFLDEVAEWLFILELCIDCIFMLDILFTFFTAYYEDKEILITNKCKIITNYLKGWFAIDLLSSFPFQLLENSTRYNKALRLLRLPRLYKLLKVFKLFRMVKFMKPGKFLEKTFFLINLNAGLRRLAKVLVFAIFFVHFYSCLWYFLAKYTAFPPDCWVVKRGLLDASNHKQYLISLYWVLQTITTVGYGEMPITTETELYFALILMIFGVSFYSYTLANLSSIFSNIDSRSAKLNAKILSMNEYAHAVKLKPNLYLKIIKVLKRNAETCNYNYFDQNQLLSELPPALRSEIISATHKNILKSLLFFKNKPPQFAINLMPLFKHISLCKDEIVYRKGDLVEELFFIIKGRIAMITQDGTIFRNYVNGSYLGDIEFFSDSKLRNYSTIAMEKTEMLVLKKGDADSIFEDYPQVKDELIKIARQRNEKLPFAIEISKKANFQLNHHNLLALKEGEKNIYLEYFDNEDFDMYMGIEERESEEMIYPKGEDYKETIISDASDKVDWSPIDNESDLQSINLNFPESPTKGPAGQISHQDSGQQIYDFENIMKPKKNMWWGSAHKKKNWSAFLPQKVKEKQGEDLRYRKHMNNKYSELERADTKILNEKMRLGEPETIRKSLTNIIPCERGPKPQNSKFVNFLVPPNHSSELYRLPIGAGRRVATGKPSCPHGENFQIGNYDLGNKLNSLDSVLRHVVDTNALLSRKLETLTTKINRIADNPNSNRRTGQLLW